MSWLNVLESHRRGDVEGTKIAVLPSYMNNTNPEEDLALGMGCLGSPEHFCQTLRQAESSSFEGQGERKCLAAAVGLLACLSPLPRTVFAFFPGLAKSGLLPLNSCLQLWDSSVVGFGPTLSHPVLTPASPMSSQLFFSVQWAALARANSGLG